MSFFVRVLVWGAGLVAVLIAGAVVYNAFFTSGPTGPRKDAAAKLVCPPKVSLPPRALGMPADDIVNTNVRIGFTVADSLATLECNNRNYKFAFESSWHTAVPQRMKSRQRLTASQGAEQIQLGIVGLPEHEFVFAGFQDIRYGESAASYSPELTVATLIAHYGPPHERLNSPGRIDLWWLYAPNNKPIKPLPAPGVDPVSAFAAWVGDSWLFGSCKRNVVLDPLAQPVWNKQCGLSIRVQIDTGKDAPNRVSRYRIAIIDQARVGSAIEMYRERVVKPKM